MTVTARLYGIDTCDQVRKARSWLRTHQVPFAVHDFRKDGLSPELLGRWMSHLPWDALLNRRGTSWRQLDPARRAAIVDQASACELMLQVPTLVRRPVLEIGNRILVGFSEPLYRGLFVGPGVGPSTDPGNSLPKPSTAPDQD
jgi:arsenate reductase